MRNVKIINDEILLDGISICDEEIERYEHETRRKIDYIYKNIEKNKTILVLKKVKKSLKDYIS